MIRRILQFHTVSDVLARGSILVLFVSLLNGLIIEQTFQIYYGNEALSFSKNASIIGILSAFVISAPVVFAFFFAAKSLYGVHQQVAKLASEDFLTGLLNRRSFFSEISQVVPDHGDAPLCSHSGYLMIGDADDFKRINDNYGHQVGDEALMLIAEAFRAANLCDATTARIGGEEFAIFGYCKTQEQAIALAERVRQSVEMSQLYHDGQPIRLTVSIGIAAVQKGDGLSPVLKAADDALYLAKHSGKNCVMIAGVAAETARADVERQTPLLAA